MSTITITKMLHGQERSVGEILYDTDPYIYPTAFGAKEYAGIVFPELFKFEGSAFSAKNIYVAHDEEFVYGCIVVITNNEPDISNYASITTRQEDRKAYLDVCERYISKLPAYLNNYPNSLYIPCVCVKATARGKGVGTQLLTYVIQNYPELNIVLHVLEENKGAIKLYSSLGFEIIEEHLDGYSFNPPPPKCCTMRRNASAN